MAGDRGPQWAVGAGLGAPHVHQWLGADAGRKPFMLTTELISIPTGVFFLVMIGTLWRGHIWMKLPTVWMFGFMANFVIGGVTGIYLSDIPLDDQLLLILMSMRRIARCRRFSPSFKPHN